ncbi:MAG: hypothetical protein HY273_07840 [Gammaproteobacteria bacterium]|nr:hypothetical protein [Gammaproteobacteria bacterium]
MMESVPDFFGWGKIRLTLAVVFCFSKVCSGPRNAQVIHNNDQLCGTLERRERGSYRTTMVSFTPSIFLS